MADRLALFTGGVFAESNAKTAHGILRYGTREVVAVVDEVSAGAVASDVVPYARRAVPIVATVADAVKLGSNVLVIGVAPFGGALTPEWRGGGRGGGGPPRRAPGAGGPARSPPPRPARP